MTRDVEVFSMCCPQRLSTTPVDLLSSPFHRYVPSRGCMSSSRCIMQQRCELVWTEQHGQPAWSPVPLSPIWLWYNHYVLRKLQSAAVQTFSDEASECSCRRRYFFHDLANFLGRHCAKQRARPWKRQDAMAHSRSLPCHRRHCCRCVMLCLSYVLFLNATF